MIVDYNYYSSLFVCLVISIAVAINYTFSTQLTAWNSVGYGAGGEPSPWCTSLYVRVSSQGGITFAPPDGDELIFAPFDVVLPLSNFNPGTRRNIDNTCYVYATTASPIALVYATQGDSTTYLFVMSTRSHNFNHLYDGGGDTVGLYGGEGPYRSLQLSGDKYARSIYYGTMSFTDGLNNDNVLLIPLTNYPTPWEQEHRTLVNNQYLSTFCPGPRLDRAVLSAQALPRTLNTASVITNPFDPAPATNVIILSSSCLGFSAVFPDPNGGVYGVDSNAAITYTTEPNPYGAPAGGPVLLIKTAESNGHLTYTGTNCNGATFVLERKSLGNFWYWRLYVPWWELTGGSQAHTPYGIVYYKIIGTSADMPAGDNLGIPYKRDSGVQIINNQAYVPGWQPDPHATVPNALFYSSLGKIRILSPADAGYTDAIAQTRTLSEQIRVRAASG